jgi:hypothetical protein
MNIRISEGLAAFAVTYFEMGDGETSVREKILERWRDLGAQAGAFHAAARSIGALPEPMIESAETTEQMRIVREALGVLSAEAQLAATVRARELLENLGSEVG